MKFISLIITILIIGFIVKKQMNSSTVTKDAINNGNDFTTPKIPTAPEDVQKFREDINELMQNTKDKRDEEINKQLNNWNRKTKYSNTTLTWIFYITAVP